MLKEGSKVDLLCSATTRAAVWTLQLAQNRSNVFCSSVFSTDICSSSSPAETSLRGVCPVSLRSCELPRLGWICRVPYSLHYYGISGLTSRRSCDTHPVGIIGIRPLVCQCFFLVNSLLLWYRKALGKKPRPHPASRKFSRGSFLTKSRPHPASSRFYRLSWTPGRDAFTTTPCRKALLTAPGRQTRAASGSHPPQGTRLFSEQPFGRIPAATHQFRSNASAARHP